ncbi:archaetidylserine decarboxylase [Blochmannia endosymbiont of Camponotus (Colobopsis) obliquus]|uniref:archaetidylserine decarboxylase n=1 Tax=Blochmannia endosymbiont of Camponotus (Colobopsis) obliquus TaxID=1505597 RepID=UPI00061A5B19|nr:archaetidylserine decarboxylase [Blochmannia endosymbiont of Camponotus (Colobopsis) obliquus]AKC60254.1 Phosphatidylserine decarboxylase proenzyme [Blochmannia endosymbiont of Camponotus (Colobopsis) obliquus]
MLNKIQIVLQYILPKRWLTEVIGLIAQWRGGLITQWMIKLFIYIYRINMNEVQQTNITKYPTFNTFFTRKLRSNARPINNNPSILVMPADGIISQIGQINKKYILQAKGHYYSLESLLAGNNDMINYFENGNFSTIYLSPSNYHRVHMPCDGILRETLYIPGDLFSVNPLITKNIANLFARNERLICLFETNFGLIAQILIGAIIMGSIETVWLGTITPPRKGVIKHWHHAQSNKINKIVLSKGQEMGLFKLGSTVINLFPKNKITFDHQLHSNHISKIGLPLAKINNIKIEQ